MKRIFHGDFFSENLDLLEHDKFEFDVKFKNKYTP